MFTSVNGKNHCISTESDEICLRGDDRPNGNKSSSLILFLH